MRLRPGTIVQFMRETGNVWTSMKPRADAVDDHAYRYPDEGKVIGKDENGGVWIEVDSKHGRRRKLYVWVVEKADEVITEKDYRWFKHIDGELTLKLSIDEARAIKSGIARCGTQLSGAVYDRLEALLSGVEK